MGFLNDWNVIDHDGRRVHIYDYHGFFEKEMICERI